VDKITAIGRPEVRFLRQLLSEAIDGNNEYLEEVGIHAEVGHGRFSSNNVTFKVTLSVKSDTGEVLKPEVLAFKEHAVSFGLSADDFGKQFQTNDRKTYEIVGLAPRSWKYPVLCKNTRTGKVWKLPIDSVVRGLSRNK